MKKEIIIFIVCLLLPLIYYRSLYYIYRNYFKISTLRKKTGLQIHHIHLGIICILIAAIILLFTGKNIYVIVILGLGLGFALDEFVPALLMPWDRKIELKAYEKGFIWTIILFIIIILVILGLSFLF